MRRSDSPPAARTALTLALLVIAGLVGCRGGGSMSIPMPKKIVDLSPVITEDLPVRQFGHRACDFLGLKERVSFTPVTPSKEAYAFGLTYFEIVANVGAHLDAPARLLKGGERPDQVPLEKLYGRARLIDLRWKDRNTPLQISDLENYSIAANDILLLYVGYTQPQDEDWPTYAPLSVQAAQWLATKKIKALATDMPSIGSFSRYADLMDKNRPPEEVWAERLAFFQAGIPVVEGLTNLGRLMGERNIVFVGFPLAIADRSGAPMRAAALIF
ncbi:MAG TPA: cyclase family protein [Candidatus Margulisiibacteriota bacterium]|nr:cyclase family protein [Candidatus Margulisiibacteriota bacterium]